MGNDEPGSGLVHGGGERQRDLDAVVYRNWS